MQIYGILLRFRGIFKENAWKIIPFLSISLHFHSFSFLISK